MIQSLTYPQHDIVFALWLPSLSLTEALIKLDLEGIPSWSVITAGIQTLMMPEGYHATLLYDDCVRAFADDLYRDPFEPEAIFAKSFFSREDQIAALFSSVISEIVDEYKMVRGQLLWVYPDSVCCQLIPDDYVEVRGKCIEYIYSTPPLYYINSV